jgi:hypothetical protein
LSLLYTIVGNSSQISFSNGQKAKGDFGKKVVVPWASLHLLDSLFDFIGGEDDFWAMKLGAGGSSSLVSSVYILPFSTIVF